MPGTHKNNASVHTTALGPGRLLPAFPRHTCCWLPFTGGLSFLGNGSVVVLPLACKHLHVSSPHAQSRPLPRATHQIRQRKMRPVITT